MPEPDFGIHPFFTLPDPVLHALRPDVEVYVAYVPVFGDGAGKLVQGVGGLGPRHEEAVPFGLCCVRFRDERPMASRVLEAIERGVSSSTSKRVGTSTHGDPKVVFGVCLVTCVDAMPFRADRG